MIQSAVATNPLSAVGSAKAMIGILGYLSRRSSGIETCGISFSRR